MNIEEQKNFKKPPQSYWMASTAQSEYPVLNEDLTRGELILVAGEHHKTGQGKDTAKHYEALIDFANENFTIEDIPYRWSTQDCMTLDGLPYVRHFTAKTPHMYIATGYGQWGMTNSIVSAMILKDLIINGKSPWQDVYNPSRKTISASAKNFVVENLNVAEQLIEGKLSSLPKDVNVKPGEGRIIEANGQKAGAYKEAFKKMSLFSTS